MLDALHRLTTAYQHYQPPWSLALQRALGRDPITLTDRATGLTFRCRAGADHMVGEILHRRVYDVPMVPVRAGDLVIDIGANHGVASCYFAWKGAEVLAFEPSAQVFPLLEHNLARNGLADRVRAVAAAVSSSAGALTLFESPFAGGGVNTVWEAFARGSGLPYPQRTEVPALGIRSILAELGSRPIRLLKLDCEGSELAILEAIAPADRARIDAVALEYHSEPYSLVDLFDFLLSWPGFHLSKLSTPGWSSQVLHLVRSEAARPWAMRESGEQIGKTE